jgi:hypothetical protein
MQPLRLTFHNTRKEHVYTQSQHLNRLVELDGLHITILYLIISFKYLARNQKQVYSLQRIMPIKLKSSFSQFKL